MYRKQQEGARKLEEVADLLLKHVEDAERNGATAFEVSLEALRVHAKLHKASSQMVIILSDQARSQWRMIQTAMGAIIITLIVLLVI